MTVPNDLNREQGRRHLKVFVVTALTLFILVAGFNLYIFKVIAAPANQRILQNNVGWERTYKPILFDETKPRVAVFGASWARDAFDYEETTAFFGRPFFNFAASGGQPYENLRFLQSALAAGSLDTVILNLDSFSAYQRRPPTQYGFNEDILSVRPDGSANTMKGWQRLFATTLSGAAIASNVSSLKLLDEARKGRPKEELLRAYDRADYVAYRPGMEALAHQMSSRTPLAEAQAAPLPERMRPSAADMQEQAGYLPHLRAALDAACKAGLQTYGYFTPHHALAFFGEPANDKLLARKLAVLEAMRAASMRCGGRLHFFDFHYPNAVTLEGMAGNLPKGEFYRSDLHPRPTVGQKMLKAMTSTVAADEDFGTDLLLLSDAQAQTWIKTRFARWYFR